MQKPEPAADRQTLSKPVSPTPVQAGRRKPKSKPKHRQVEQRTPTTRSFPASTFEEALTLAQAIQQFASGQRVRRLTLFHHLGKSPDSGPSRQLVTNSSKYGLTQGGYQAEHLELTEEGRIATSQEVSPQEHLRARFRLAIENIAPFKALYERFKGSKLPGQAVMRDFLIDEGYKADEVPECVDTFILNVKFLGLLRTVAGAERLLPVDHLLEEAVRSAPEVPSSFPEPARPAKDGGATSARDTVDWSKICFYVTPIGEPDSDERKHADLFLSHIVEPALEEFGLKVVRADQIGKPGMITGQVIQHVVRSRLVIADLSFHNPNVLYELSLRHACRLPTVHLIRESERIPFDLDQFRTIQIDTSSIYTLVPSLETYKSEIANQVRRALANPESVDNPITVFCPELKVSIPTDGNP